MATSSRSEHLAHLVAGQGVERLEARGDLVRREVLAAQRLERVGVDRCARAWHHERPRHLAQAVVGDAGHRALGHVGREADHLGDLLGEDLEAAAVDHVRDATLDPEEALVVDAAEIAGVEPAVDEPAVHVVAVGGALVDHRRAHEDLTASSSIRDAQLHVLVGAADRAEVGVAELLGVLRAPADDLAADLGLAPPVEHEHAEPVAEPAGLQRRQRRGDAAHVLQRRERRDRRRRRPASSSPPAAARWNAAGSARRSRRTPAVSKRSMMITAAPARNAKITL